MSTENTTVKREQQSIVFRISYGGKSASELEALGLSATPSYEESVDWRKGVVEALKGCKPLPEGQGVTATVERMTLSKLPRKELIVALLNGNEAVAFSSRQTVFDAIVKGGVIHTNEAKVRAI